MSDTFVLDACALIAFLANEQGAAEVEEVLKAGSTGEATLYINKVNLLEVYYAT